MHPRLVIVTIAEKHIILKAWSYWAHGCPLRVETILSLSTHFASLFEGEEIKSSGDTSQEEPSCTAVNKMYHNTDHTEAQSQRAVRALHVIFAARDYQAWLQPC
jgi:hypothetical protein